MREWVDAPQRVVARLRTRLTPMSHNGNMASRYAPANLSVMFSKAVLAVAFVQIAACGGSQSDPSVVPTNPVVAAPSPAPAPPITTSSTSTTSTTTTTTVPIEVMMTPGERSCPGWIPLAQQVGWPVEQLDKLSYVMWRESRCDPTVHNSSDPVSGSRGLTQINGYWCRPNQWTSNGWLQDRDVLETCDDLYDPETNLRAALLIWYYGVEKGRTGWGPWAV